MDRSVCDASMILSRCSPIQPCAEPSTTLTTGPKSPSESSCPVAGYTTRHGQYMAALFPSLPQHQEHSQPLMAGVWIGISIGLRVRLGRAPGAA